MQTQQKARRWAETRASLGPDGGPPMAEVPTPVPRLHEMARAGEVLLCYHGTRRAPGNRLARQKQGTWKASPDLVEVVQGRDNSAAFVVPGGDQIEQVVGRASIDCGEGLVEQDDPRVLQ